LVLFAAAFLLGRACPAQTPPLTGTAAPEYAAFDQVVLAFMERIDCAAATAAVSRRGKLMYSRGYGWSDAHKKKPTAPDALLRIAGLTQPITAAAVKKLILQGKLTLDTRAFELVNLKPPRGSTSDSRLNQITVGQLLANRGGWDAKVAFDPFTRLQKIEKRLRLGHRPRPVDVIRYMLGEPLQFDPGTREVFSNFGYCVLGRVIEKASGKAYGAYVVDNLLKPLKIVDMKLARNLLRERDPREVWYPVKDVPVEAMDSCAGLVASAPAVCEFLERYWLNGDLRQAAEDRQWKFFGNIASTTVIVRQRADGYNIAVLCNGRRSESSEDADDELLDRLVNEAIDKVTAESVN
jgi:CubicO group peptidase (beta-lactamase class C family)